MQKDCILVLGGDERTVRATVDDLRQAGWEAFGTSDSWEAILLVSRRTFSLIVQDPRVRNFGDADLEEILTGDPALKDVPRILTFTRQDLLDSVRNALAPGFPSEESSSRDATRFVRRSRPMPALQ